jgi:hypothetical protein
MELEKKIAYLSYYMLLLAGLTCRDPAQCKHSPWTIKGRGHPLEHRFLRKSLLSLHKD